MLAAMCALALLPTTVAAADLDVRLRVVWGGGEARSWQGTIRLSRGSLSDPLLLGMEADEPGSMQLTDTATLQVFPRIPRSYDGVDLRIQAPPDARLIVSLSAPGLEPLDPIELPLAKVLKGIQQVDLDEQQNRLLAQRSPGDVLRVTLARDSLVFSPGEKLELHVQPLSLDLAANTTYLIGASLRAPGSDEELHSEEHELRTGGDGQAAALALDLSLPAAEGVYDLSLALYPKRLATSLVRGKPLARRQVQCVVIAPVRPIDRTSAEWGTAYDLDPANPTWWERMARMPSLRRIPNLASDQLASGPAKTKNLLGRPWIELAPAGWQAYPLALDAPGQPHILEVEYASDYEQTLGVSLVEPGAEGKVQPIGVDSGFEVGPPAAGHQPELKRHRLVFWPRTKSPWVLLTNRRDDRPALVGRMKVLAGPAHLAPLALPPTGFATRTWAACFDKPLVAENFSAPEALDPATRRTFDDWTTFYQAGQRLVSALQHGGYNAVVLNVVHEGSALYPSRLLEPTPRHDTGVYFESGQDPVRKDVLELILRLCDRAGIQVIPAVQFCAPLPVLEPTRLAGGPEAVGLEPIGVDGQSWLARHGARRGTGVYYNALDSRVQAAMQQVVAEIVERYSEHASFGGVAVQWTTEGYAILPDAMCSYDDTTIKQFETAIGQAIPSAGGPPLASRDAFLHGEGESAWLAWRAQRMTEFYRQMQAEIAAARPSAKLYLSAGDLLGGRQVQQALRPKLPDSKVAADVLLMLGIDPPQLAAEPGIVLPRPYRLAAGSPAERQSLDAHWNQADELDVLFARRGGTSALHFHEPAQLPLPAFDKVSPFGADNTLTWLVAQISPAGDANRQRLVHSLAVHDSPLLADGGWLLPLGQEEALRPFVQVFRRLPAEPFATARPQSDAAASGVVVRTLATKTKTYFYAVNDTPWPARVEIDFQGSPTLRVQSYCEDRKATQAALAGGITWSIELAPYDLAGGEVNSPRATVTDVRSTHAGNPAESMREQIREVLLRANALRDPQPRPWLGNASFEEEPRMGQIPGWVHGSVPAMAGGASVAVDPARGRAGEKSLRISSRSVRAGQPAPVLWVRSDPFAPPKTGRITVVAWMRIADPARQPQLRLAVEGKRDGQVYYQYQQVGLDNQGRPTRLQLSEEWSSFPVILPSLPLAGLTDLRVGFDLMGEGEVWIDEVQVYDLWFTESERDALLKSVATAQLQWRDGQLADCQSFVEGYWPRFLREHVPLPEVRDATAGGPKPPAAKPPETSASRSTWDKMRSWLPKAPSFWR
jgi:hypothetical protein